MRKVTLSLGLLPPPYTLSFSGICKVRKFYEISDYLTQEGEGSGVGTSWLTYVG